MQLTWTQPKSTLHRFTLLYLMLLSENTREDDLNDVTITDIPNQATLLVALANVCKVGVCGLRAERKQISATHFCTAKSRARQLKSKDKGSGNLKVWHTVFRKDSIPHQIGHSFLRIFPEYCQIAGRSVPWTIQHSCQCHFGDLQISELTKASPTSMPSELFQYCALLLYDFISFHFP
eukprot:Gb_23752 [translate_table: standard]